MGLGLLFYGALAGAALLWRLLAEGVPPWRAPGAEPVAWPLQLAAGAAAGAVLLVASRVWTAHTRAGRRLADALARAVGPLSGGAAAVLALASGVAEEAFFRGALQAEVGWIAASLLFGLAHLVPRRDLAPWAIFAVGAGALFGALFAWTGTILAPAVAHVLVNAVNLRWLSQRGL